MTGQSLFRGLATSLFVGCVCTVEAMAGITASGNFNNPSTTTQHVGDKPDGFEITDDVGFDPSKGPWIKQLVNDPQGIGISSGNRVNIIETFTNTGTQHWTDWHEEILTTTIFVGGGGGGGGGGEPPPGFLFDKNFFNLMADRGAGFEGLVENVDYTKATMEFLGPGSGNDNMGLEAIWIFFEPHAAIQPGDTIKIEKQIFEVHLDGNIWQPGEFVEIAQYPTVPEPSCLLLAATLLGLPVRGRGRRVTPVGR